MADFADSLIKNLGLHAAPRLSSPVNLSDKIGQLGETLRYARTSLSLASLSQALIGSPASTCEDTAAESSTATAPVTPPAPEHAKGRLSINLTEARNLTIADPTKADIYCLVQYDKNVFSTNDQVTHDNDGNNSSSDQQQQRTAPTASIPIPNASQRRHVDVFQLAMEVSCPKWRYNATFDVCNDNDELIVHIYDRGDRLPNGDDRFLGMISVKPSLVPKKMFDQWHRLVPRADEASQAYDGKVTGELRLQIEYTTVGPAKLTPEAFRTVRMIGHGSFGKVYQVVKRDSKRTYAMKVLSKKLLIAQNEVTHTIAERNVMIRTISNPFIVTLKFSFQTADHLFLVMDYVPGGELFSYLQREHYLNEDRARFYVAELVCALEHIHMHQVVYRDLKPENILLDAQGHIALADFGLSKELKRANETTTTFCGTSEYLAPEMVRQEPYTQAVDWWSLGILLYELLVGGAPFHSVHLDVLYRKICKAPLKFPAQPSVSPEAKDLIAQLLDRNPATRVGAEQVKAHPFFRNIQWDLIAQKQVRPPFKPVLANQRQTSSSSSLQPPFTMKQPPSFLAVRKNATRPSSPLSSSNQSAFRGFSYVRDDTASIASSRRTVASSLFSDDEDDDDFWS
ncbi:kinase-like domain-containing protein [Zychaea mexicana]|uniref:kinase-like domain-containing protein n=1 Tax=Zychaea mexicana TaxID=64656 RepID=UPI0022FE3171|nr:kinase-like domain-containing protein [Zychaea mexicana]KAI9499483.1 kinase-like domain-containing protein [Zychaea mexicana]